MRLSVETVEHILASTGANEVGAAFVRRVRTSEPSRTVQAGKRNIRNRYASLKMGMALEMESSTELDYGIVLEYDDNVLEFWEQPEQIDVSFPDKRNRNTRCTYTADYLVLLRDRVEVVQVKTDEECLDLIERQSRRWTKVGEEYVDLAAREAFAAMGLPHRVVTNRYAPKVLSENYRLLMQSRTRSIDGMTSEAARDALEFVRESGCCTINELASEIGVVDITTILKLIDDGSLFALLREQRLCETQSCMISADNALLIEAWTVSQASMIPRSSVGPSTDRVLDLRGTTTVARRLRELNAPPDPARARTHARWKAALKTANGDILSLKPKTEMRGNRTRRISQRAIEFLDRAIAQYVLVAKPCHRAAAYRGYLAMHADAQCEGHLGRAVSFNTFVSAINRLPIEATARIQGGRRAANAVAPPVDPALRSLRPARAFEKAHIDHYHADQHVVIGFYGGEKRTKRLWITVMIDDATSAVLAISVSLKPPSRLSCCAVIRECVRRHGRLPESIMVDNGSEFQSVYFEVLLARYAVTKMDRPPEAPRFGGKMEATFKTAKKELMESLLGSTANDERGRAVSPSHRGQLSAVWPIEKIYGVYDDYFYRMYNARIAGSDLRSPSEVLDDSLRRFSCSGRVVVFDDEFVLATAVPNKPLAVSHRGIHFRDVWYWHPGLISVARGARVPALIEPLDKNCIYASVNGRWLTCFSGDASLHRGITLSSCLQSIVAIESRSEKATARQEYQTELGRNTQRHRAAEKELIAEREATLSAASDQTTSAVITAHQPKVEPYPTFPAIWNERGRRP